MLLASSFASGLVAASAVSAQTSSHGARAIRAHPGAAAPARAAATPRLEWEARNGSGQLHESDAAQSCLMRETLGRWNLGGCGRPDCRSNRAGFHPGTRVTVEASTLHPRSPSHSMPPAVIRLQADFRKRGYWHYRNCFEMHARDAADRGGDTWLRVHLAPDGTVARARLVNTTLSSRRMTECVRSVTQGVRASRVEKHHSTIRLRVRLFPGDVPLPAPRRAAPGLTELDPDALGSSIDPIRRAMERCVLQATERDPLIWGRLSLAVVIGNEGRVQKLAEAETHFPDPEVIACCRATLADTSLLKSVPGLLHLSLRVGELPPSSAGANGAARELTSAD